MGEPLDQLDRAVDIGLAQAGADTPEMTDAAFEAGRERVLAAINGDEHSVVPQRRLLVAAASVAVLVTGGLVVQAIDFGGTGSTPKAAAAGVLRQAADLANTVKDTPVGPGQYRYVARRDMGIVGYSSGGASTGELTILEQWIPADPTQEWMERRRVEGKERWLPGLEGKRLSPTPPGLLGEFKGKCGAFAYWAENEKPRVEHECDHGSWNRPTAEFLAGLPSDPRQLYELLVKETSGDAGAVVAKVGGLLSTGMLPAEYRARFYRALEHVPGLVITDESVNLEGRKGTAVGTRRGKDYIEIIIDPGTGEYIGDRVVIAEEDMGIEPGSVRGFSAVTMGVVDAPWVAPVK